MTALNFDDVMPYSLVLAHTTSLAQDPMRVTLGKPRGSTTTQIPLRNGVNVITVSYNGRGRIQAKVARPGGSVALAAGEIPAGPSMVSRAVAFTVSVDDSENTWMTIAGLDAPDVTDRTHARVGVTIIPSGIQI